MIKKYKKKLVVIEAVQYDGTHESFSEIQEFCNTIEVTAYNDKKLKIPTLEGFHDASINDWIIKGIKGEFYPCKPDIFEEIYEEVDNDEPILKEKECPRCRKIRHLSKDRNICLECMNKEDGI